MTCTVLLEIVSAPSTALARPIKAPVSSSCNLAVSAFFPQTPAFPVQPVHPTEFSKIQSQTAAHAPHIAGLHITVDIV